MKNLIKEKGSNYYNIEEIKTSLKNTGIYEDQFVEIKVKQFIRKEIFVFIKISKADFLKFQEETINELIPKFIKAKIEEKEATKKITEIAEEMTKYYNKLNIKKTADYEIIEDDQKFKKLLNLAYGFEIFKDKIKKEADKKLGTEKSGKDMFTHLFTTNETAHFFLTNENEEIFLKGSDLELKKEILKDFKAIGFKALEIPLNFDITELSKFLKDIKKIKEFFKLENIDITLRIKKFNKKYSFTGLFNPELKTIVLDGRDKNSFIHELGHYIYENKIEIENFKPTETESLKNYKEGTHVSYDLESEKFALSFEEKFLNLFF